MPLAIGTLLNNRYEIRAILGQGGMGAVYRAEDKHLNIPVAVKENLFLTREYGDQFKREACILAGLRHSNLPHVIDYFGLENQGQYLVMDFVEGEDLRQRMERVGALPDREVALIGISICDALIYMHTRQKPLGPVVHRDIKPGNIKITSERQAVLVDFGLAKVMQGGQVTSTGARAMTPGYSPPEQYGHARTDTRSDIYSLGATLYAALTGVIPEDGLARMTGKAELTPVRELAPRVNKRLAEAIERAMEVESDDRYQTAEEFRRALIEAGELATFYQEKPTIAPPPADAGKENGASGEREESKVPWVRERSRASRRRRSKGGLGWIAVPSLLVLGVAAYLFYMARPDLANPVLGYFGIAPTATLQPTQLAAMTTTLPPATAVNSTTTPAEAAVTTPGDLALTGTPEGTPTIAPPPTETPQPTPTLTGGGRSQIAYASNSSGIYNIWLVSPDKPLPQQLTGEQDGACQPSWSPDGLQMAYISPCPGKQDVYEGSNIWIAKVSIDGKILEKSQLTYGLQGDYDPAWSPDGKRIAFTSLRNGKSGVYILNLEDNTQTQISTLDYNDKQPAWAPSGLQLVFVRVYSTGQLVITTDTGVPQKVITASGPISNMWPSWSVDGQLIFYSQLDEKTPPWLMYKRYEERDKLALENRIPAKSTGKDGPFAMVRQSPDGLWFAYESWPDGDHNIYIMAYNGANQKRLTKDPGFDFGPAWRPILSDGQ